MRKYLLCLLAMTIIISSGVYAEDVNWDSFSDLDNVWDGQKPVTNKQFEQVMTQLEAKKNKKQDKKKLKGNELNKFEGNDILTNIKEAVPLLNLTVNAIIGDEILIPGHYKITGEKQNNKIYLSFYQGHRLMAKVEAIETLDDFDSNEIYFLKTEPIGNNQLKIMFGSMEFNAYIFVNYIVK